MKILLFLHSRTAIVSLSKHATSTSSAVLYHSLIDIEVEGSIKEKNKWYILSGYPYGKLLSDQTITNAEQLKNFQKIESKWNVFVDELKKSGKYIN